MATTVVNGDNAEIKICCYTPKQISLNIMHYRLDITAGTWTDQDVADAMALAFHTAYKNSMPNEAKFRGVGVRLLVAGPPAEVNNVGQDGAGTALGDLSATQVCGIITKRTAIAGRRFRGRMYIGFVSNLDIDQDGNPLPLYIGGLLGISNAVGPTVPLVNGANTMDAVLRVKSETVPGFPTFQQVTNLTQRNIFGTQRSRGGFGAQNVPPW